MLLLHGGMDTAESFDAQAAGLSRYNRVYVPERRGHGRTADVPGPLTYDLMAEDNAAFLRARSCSGASGRLERRRRRRFAHGVAASQAGPQVGLYRKNHDARRVATAVSGAERAVRRAAPAGAGSEVRGSITRRPGALQGGLLIG